MFKWLALLFKSPETPDVYWERDNFGGGRLRYKNWAAVEKKFAKQFEGARRLAIDIKKHGSVTLDDAGRPIKD